MSGDEVAPRITPKVVDTDGCLVRQFDPPHCLPGGLNNKGVILRREDSPFVVSHHVVQTDR